MKMTDAMGEAQAELHAKLGYHLECVRDIRRKLRSLGDVVALARQVDAANEENAKPAQDATP
jgi:hypothetical protein